jgi:hypothetical protein
VTDGFYEWKNLEAGEWTMKIGDQAVRGYFAMTLVREVNGFKFEMILSTLCSKFKAVNNRDKKLQPRQGGAADGAD